MKTVLLVDDESDLREVLPFDVEQLGYKCIEANSGNSAIQIIRAGQSIDLVITDLKMAEGDGLYLISKMKEEKIIIPTILVTGNLDLDQDNLDKSGATSILLKPYSLETLKSCLDSVIGARVS